MVGENSGESLVETGIRLSRRGGTNSQTMVLSDTLAWSDGI